MRLGSLCTGYGGLDLAVTMLLPAQHAWHTEVDPAASTVLAAHWPDVPNLGDITQVDWATTPSVDVLVGGIPCQGWSAAGKRWGADDDRDLWPVRKFEADGAPRRGALDALRTRRPTLFVLENVPGLLTIEHGAAFGTMLADLDQLGYTVSWTTVGACAVGACHHRHRVFLAATLVDVVPPSGDPVARRADDVWTPIQQVLFGDAEAVKWPASGMTSGGLVWPLPVRTCGADSPVLPTLTAHCEPRRRGMPSAVTAARRMESGRRNLEDAVALLPTLTVADSRGSRNATAGRRTAPDGFDLGWTLSDVVYAGRIGDQAMLPTPTARDATRGAGWGDQAGRPLSEVIALLPTPRASDAAKGGPNQRGSSGDLALPAAVQPGRFGVYEAAVSRQEQAFCRPAPDPTELGRLGKPRLSPAFCEWLMGLPAGWITAHVGRSDAIRIAGNGVVWQQAVRALETLPTFRAASPTLSRLGVAA